MKTFNALIPNTFGIETCCDCLIEFQTVEELISCYPSIAQARRDGNLLIVGRGSNLLPVDDFHGMVLRSRIMGIHSEEDGNNAMVTCGSGETMDEVIEWCIGKGYYGMENLSLIPGDVGASAVQNITVRKVYDASAFADYSGAHIFRETSVIMPIAAAYSRMNGKIVLSYSMSPIPCQKSPIQSSIMETSPLQCRQKIFPHSSYDRSS